MEDFLNVLDYLTSCRDSRRTLTLYYLARGLEERSNTLWLHFSFSGAVLSSMMQEQYRPGTCDERDACGASVRLSEKT